jgi:hypothetical protein
MQNQDFRSTPSYLQIFSGLSGAFFLCIIPYFEREAIFRMAKDPAIGNLIEGGAFLLMLGFGISCLVVGISYPVIHITADKFIFKRPLLFYTRRINRIDIRQSRETVFLINPTHRGREVEIYHNRKLVMELKGKTQISFSSLEVPEYTHIRFLIRGGRVAQELTQMLDAQRRRLAKIGIGFFVLLGFICLWVFLV